MNTSPVKVLALSGSLRAASTNTLLLRAAARLAPSGVTIELFEGIGELPHFNPDLEDAPSAAVTAWKCAVSSADALLISTPEYAHGLPGSFKNALDWLVGGIEMVGKPVALLNPSPWSVHAPAALAEILRTMSAEVIPSAAIAVTLRGAQPPGFDPTLEPSLAQPIRAGLAALAAAVRMHRSTAAV